MTSTENQASGSDRPAAISPSDISMMVVVVCVAIFVAAYVLGMPFAAVFVALLLLKQRLRGGTMALGALVFALLLCGPPLISATQIQLKWVLTGSIAFALFVSWFICLLRRRRIVFEVMEMNGSPATQGN